MNLEEILTLFSAKPAGQNQWKAHCPCHDDKRESLSIGLDGVKILIHCHAGCETNEILSAMGLKPSDLFTDDKPPVDWKQIAIEYYCRKNGWKYITTYDYCYGRYNDGLIKVRYMDADGKKQMRWMHPNPENPNGKYVFNRKGTEKRLYAAGDISSAMVFLAEGEKDADTLHKLTGVTAVSAADGAQKKGDGSKWADEYTEQLRGKRVYILWDNDEIGKDFAGIEAQKLSRAADGVYMIDISQAWKDIPPKGDITDMVEAIGDEQTQEFLRTALQNTQPLPKPAAEPPRAAETAISAEPKIIRIMDAESNIAAFNRFLSDIQTEAFKPIPTGFKAFDKALCDGEGGIQPKSLVILTAAPAAGKTTFCQQILEEAAGNGNDVLFLNLEMSDTQLYARSISRWLRMRGGKHYSATTILQGYRWTDQQRSDILEAAEQYSRFITPHITYNPQGMSQNYNDIRRILMPRLEQAISQGKRAPIVCLDYLHLVRLENTEAVETIKLTIELLKNYAIKGNTFAIAISASNRRSNQTEQTLYSGRDTSSIEYTADYQLALERKEAALQPGSAELTEVTLRILKNRLGKTGDTIFYYEPAYNSFIPKA